MKENKNSQSMNWLVPMLLGIVVILLVVLLVVVLIGKDKSNTPSSNSGSNQTQIEDEENHDIQNNSTYITKEEALNIALKHAKLERNSIYDISVEFDYKYGKTVYEIDFDYQKYEYEYYIDATTGDILHQFKEWN